MIRIASLTLAASVVAGLLCGQPGRPATPPKSDFHNATIITADEFDLDFGSPKRVAIYRGNVRVEDPEMDIRCEEMTVTFASPGDSPASLSGPAKKPEKPQPAGLLASGNATGVTNSAPIRPMVGMGGNITSIVAERKVEIFNKVDKTRATGNKAVYTSSTELLVLTGNPVMYTEQGEVRGDLIIMDRRTNKLSVKRASVILGEGNGTKGKTPAPPAKGGTGKPRK